MDKLKKVKEDLAQIEDIEITSSWFNNVEIMHKGVNKGEALKDYEELINAALESKVDAIISGAGLPLRLPELVKDHDVLIAPIVSSGKACKVIIKHWLKKYQRTPDFIVIEGSQAGGHLGFKKEQICFRIY